ncbi:MAG: aminotransferase class V-fold PLP-dependent enzyme [Alphaproteobacteria bacterium]
MERAPDQFFRRRVVPGGGDSYVRAAARVLAPLVGTTAERLAFTDNATTGVGAVLAAQKLQAGDEILLTDHAYNAVRLAIEAACARTGAVARAVHIPIPLGEDDTAVRILAGAGPRTKLAILDHISSPTALVFPVAEIVRGLRARGVRVLIDGAHGLGQVPLALDELGADYYTSNAHKWFYAPKGTAFLYARPEASDGLLPLAISHFNHFGFPQAFDYVGTRDVTGWLALRAAAAFVARHGAEAIMAHNNALGLASVKPMRALGAIPVGPDEMAGAMRAFILPQRRPATADDARELMLGALWERHRIQVSASLFQARLLLRVSAQIYADAGDIARLCDVLSREGWPAAEPIKFVNGAKSCRPREAK